ncbi:MAG: hypothetical protein WAO58_11885 [Fimbriimonadaceae bacterium]
MPSDIPRSDAAFDAMWTAFMAYASANLANLGIAALDPEWTQLVTAKTDWDAKYPAHVTGQATAQSLTAAKDVSRETGQNLLENLIAILRANKVDVSDAELQALLLSLRDTILTPSPVPTTRPVLKIDHSQRQEHTLSWVDETTPTSIAKPAGVYGCQLFLKVGGAAPTGIQECRQVVTDTKTPYTYDFDPEEWGQPAYWIGRWENTRGEPGPISETVTATVVA